MYWRNQGIIFAHKREFEICSSVSYLRVSTGKQAKRFGITPKNVEQSWPRPAKTVARLTASAERHQTLADIRAQTPAKFTHIADRWPRRCAQGRRGGAALNSGRLAMKRATSSPLAKDAASLSIFSEIARLIAGPDTPQWLATHFKRWASSLMLDRFVELALQEAAKGGSSDPHLESGARLKKPRPDGSRSGTVDHVRWPS